MKKSHSEVLKEKGRREKQLYLNLCYDELKNITKYLKKTNEKQLYFNLHYDEKNPLRSIEGKVEARKATIFKPMLR